MTSAKTNIIQIIKILEKFWLGHVHVSKRLLELNPDSKRRIGKPKLGLLVGEILRLGSHLRPKIYKLEKSGIKEE